jgi:hypothetical protein
LDKREELYVEWLISQICINEYTNYKLLIRRLWYKEFYSLVPHDDNRAADGLNFRKKWWPFIAASLDDRTLINEDPNFGPCRVLECLLALEERIGEQLFGSCWMEQMAPAEIFWGMVRNMGLLEYSDDYLEADRIDKIDDILSTFLDRKYAKDGSGGNIFVVKDTNKDFRKLELWAQMMLYCQWKWPI